MTDAASTVQQNEQKVAQERSKPAAAWRNALAQVQAQQSSAGPGGKDPGGAAAQDVTEAHYKVDGCVTPQNLPAAAASAAPRLAVMVLAARSLPGSSSEDLQRLHMYVKAAVHRQGQIATAANKKKTHCTLQHEGSAAWSSLLTFSPEASQDMLTLSLRHKQKATNKTVVLGFTAVPLSDVLNDPASWVGRKQLPLGGQRLQDLGATLEVQLFLSADRIQGPLSVLAATWNVGNEPPPPPDVLRTSWLKGVHEGQHHLVAVGAQECNYAKEPRKDTSRRHSDAADLAATEDATIAVAAEAAALVEASQDHSWLVTESTQLKGMRSRVKDYLLQHIDSAAVWQRHIAAALGPGYWLLCSKHMFQTRLLVFARVDIVPYISHITTGFEATGLGRVGLNKGGVAASLKLDNTRLAFICSHLAAHQNKTAQRNADVAEICAGMPVHTDSAAGARGCDVVTGFHHVVWMGDLNYRLEYGQQAITQSDSPVDDDFKSLKADIEAGKTQELLQLDQLHREQRAGRVFAGFQEGQIGFAPTFKVFKGKAGFDYDQKRSPAWCDRVLFKSALPHKQASCSSYSAAAHISSSDHKPVAAELSLPLVTNTVTSGRPIDSPPFKLYVMSVTLEGASSWQRLQELLLGSAADIAVAGGGDCEQRGSQAKQQQRGSLLTIIRGWVRQRKLNLVLSGACMAKQQHELKVNGDVVANGLSAAAAVCTSKPADQATSSDSRMLGASLLLREDHMALLPGGIHDLQDDWLLLRVVVEEGLQSRTIARGIVPLQPAVAELQTRSFKPVQVPVQLESNSAAAGTALVSLRLMSSQAGKPGMHEAIRRMRALAQLHSHSAPEAHNSTMAKLSRARSDTRVHDWRGGHWLMEGYAKVVDGIRPLAVRRASSV